MAAAGMRAASRHRHRSPRRHLTRCHRAGWRCPWLWHAFGDAPRRFRALPAPRSAARARWCCSELLRARAPLTRARVQQERAKSTRQEAFNRRRGSSVCSKAPCLTRSKCVAETRARHRGPASSSYELRFHRNAPWVCPSVTFRVGVMGIRDWGRSAQVSVSEREATRWLPGGQSCSLVAALIMAFWTLSRCTEHVL